MPGVLLRDHFPCEFDGESYYISEIDAARVNIPDAGAGVSIRIIPHAKLNNLKYGDTTLLLTFNDARLLAQAILSVAFEPVRGRFTSVTGDVAWENHPQPHSTSVGAPVTDPEPPDLLGAEPETGRLPADPRKMPVVAPDDLPQAWGVVFAGQDPEHFTPLDTDALERVDGPTIGGER